MRDAYFAGKTNQAKINATIHGSNTLTQFQQGHCGAIGRSFGWRFESFCSLNLNKIRTMAKTDYLDNDNHKVLWHGFDSSVIFNKKTGKQEFVRNSEHGIPKRHRFTYKNTW